MAKRILVEEEVYTRFVEYAYQYETVSEALDALLLSNAQAEKPKRDDPAHLSVEDWRAITCRKG